MDQQEADILVMGEEEQEDLRRLAQQQFPILVYLTWNRAVIGIWMLTLKTGIPLAHVSIPTSDNKLQAKLGMSWIQVEQQIRPRWRHLWLEKRINP